jgi:RNA polymerase sigma factor (sigma-70 family)
LQKSSYRKSLSQTDEQLVRKCLSGNDEAWSALIDKYKNLIFSIPVKYGFPPDEADEIFQDVCSTLVVELPRLRNPQALAAWLIQTTSRRCFQFKRERQRYVLTDPKEFSSGQVDDIPENIVREIERAQILRSAVAELAPRCQEMVHLLFFQEPPLPYEDVARKIGVAKGSIGFLRMRCLERLRKALEEKGFQ